MPEKGLLTRDQVPDCPDFTRAKNKLPFWDKYFKPHHNIYIYIYIYVCVCVCVCVSAIYIVENVIYKSWECRAVVLFIERYVYVFMDPKDILIAILSM